MAGDPLRAALSITFACPSTCYSFHRVRHESTHPAVPESQHGLRALFTEQASHTWVLFFVHSLHRPPPTPIPQLLMQDSSARYYAGFTNRSATAAATVRANSIIVHALSMGDPTITTGTHVNPMPEAFGCSYSARHD